MPNEEMTSVVCKEKTKEQQQFQFREDYHSWFEVMARLKSKLTSSKDTAKSEKVSLKRVARLAMVLTLSGCFAVHIWNWVFKCLDRDTIMVLRTNQDTDMRLPTVAVCPSVGSGFIKTSMTSLGLPDTQWAAHERKGLLESDWKRPDNRSQVDFWHEQSTIGYKEVVSKVTFHMGNDGKIIQLYPISQEEIIDRSEVKLTEMESLRYGKCFLISVDFAIVNPVDYLDISILFPQGIESYDVLSFEKGLEVPGISLDSWSGPVHQNKLEKDAKHYLTLTKRSYYLDPKNSYCHNDVTRADSVNCLVDKSKEQISKNFSIEKCYWPGLGAFASEEDPVCGSPDEVNNMAVAAESALLRLVGKRQCLPNCRVDVVDDRWRVAKHLIRDQENPSSLLRVGYIDTEVEIASESVLYDLVTMLSSVGGSLGLFLGFSFLDCGLAAIEWGWKEKK